MQPSSLGPVVVNERTAVATAFAFAQFVGEAAITGDRYGMPNAVRMREPGYLGEGWQRPRMGCSVNFAGLSRLFASVRTTCGLTGPVRS
jgi:hypothetical protein